MKYRILILMMLLPVMAFAGDGDWHWKRTKMDASRTGVIVPSENNVTEALGTVKGNVYTAPNGKVYKGGSIPKVAKTVIAAQETMASVKKVVGYAPEAMESHAPESPLSNWFADLMIGVTEELSGKHVDMSLGNFGGIRVPMPQGDVIYDDIRSMFPFRNNVYYVALHGRDIRALLESMLERRRVEVLGGVRITVLDWKLTSVEIGGEPLDDDKVYGVATISFLLAGGDNLFVENNAVEVIDCGKDIFEAVMMYVEAETAAGRPLTGEVDGRVKIMRTGHQPRLMNAGDAVDESLTNEN